MPETAAGEGELCMRAGTSRYPDIQVLVQALQYNLTVKTKRGGESELCMGAGSSRYPDIQVLVQALQLQYNLTFKTKRGGGGWGWIIAADSF